jgi:hypothetical protein
VPDLSAASADGVRFLLESSGGGRPHADVDSASDGEVGALSLLLANGASLASPRPRLGSGGKAPYSPDSPLQGPL